MGISQNLDRLVALHRSRLRSHGETEFFRQQIVDRHLRLHGSHYFSCFGRLGQALAPDDRRAILCAELLERYDVCFMADRIECHADHQLALRLPFHLLSGDYYWPPEPI